jgi:hypothetical protein
LLLLLPLFHVFGQNVFMIGAFASAATVLRRHGARQHRDPERLGARLVLGSVAEVRGTTT